MHKNKLTYEELLSENDRLKKQLSELDSSNLIDDLKKKNAQLNEFNEELQQMLDVVKKQKESIEEHETKFQLLENNISEVIWMMNLKGNFTYASPSVEKFVGYTQEEIIKLNSKDVLTTSSYKDHQDILRKRLEKEQRGEITDNISLRVHHVKKNGDIFLAEVSSNPLRDKAGKLIGLVGVTRDISKQEKAESEIQKLTVAVEQSPASIVITDIEGTIQYVNKTFCEVTGYSSEEAIGQNPRILKSGKMSKEFYQDLWSTIKAGKVWRGEIINKTKNGDLYWERVRIAPIKNDENEVINYVAVKENVTEQKKAAIELKESQERYKTLSDISLEGIIIHDNGLILDVNSSVVEITGYLAKELVGKKMVEKMFTAESVEIIWKNIKNKYELSYEVTGVKKDGSRYPAEVEAKQYIYKGREVRVAALRDITYRKRIDDVLRTSLKMTELLKNHTEQEIIDWGLEEAVRLSDSKIGFFHYVNEDQNTVSLQTWTKETIKNCDVPDKKEHYPISEAGTWMDSFHERKPVVHNDYQSLKHKKGLPTGHFPLIRYISLPVIEDDKVKIIFGVGNKNVDYNEFDVHLLGLFAKTVWMVIQRKRAERELQDSNAAKDKFFSIISHDLRSPIGSINTMTEILSESIDEFSVEETKNFIQAISDNVSNAYNLLDNMLLWAQSHRNKIEFLPQLLNFNVIVQDVIRLQQLDADNKNIAIKQKIEDNFLVYADANMLSTVIRNLISNAIKFTNKGGDIHIHALDYNKAAIQVCVKDSGVGISETNIAKLFDIGEAVSTKGTENERGTGLGLVLCKEFVERNGGKIWVESKVGEGSTFCFTVPLGITS